MTLSAHVWIRLSLIQLLALLNFWYVPLLLKLFLHCGHSLQINASWQGLFDLLRKCNKSIGLRRLSWGCSLSSESKYFLYYNLKFLSVNPVCTKSLDATFWVTMMTHPDTMERVTPTPVNKHPPTLQAIFHWVTFFGFENGWREPKLIAGSWRMLPPWWTIVETLFAL